MEIETLKVTPKRGGNHHPLSVRSFILDYLADNGEQYIAEMHRAYKRELDRIARENGRRYRYHKPRYHSFEMAVQMIRREELIEFSGREEESDNPMFDNKEWKPIRRFYRLKT